MKIRTILTLLALAPFGTALVAPAQAAPIATTLQTPAPIALGDKEDKGPRKPAPKPGPRTGGEGE